MKKVHFTAILTFGFLIGILSFVSLFSSSTGFSSVENRQLASRTPLSLQSLITGTFEQGYETFLLENFPFRNQVIEGFHVCTRLFYWDKDIKKENTLMAVQADDFVSAMKPETSEVQNESEKEPLPEEKKKDELSTRAEEGDKDQPNQRLSDYLILAGDRVMMPKGPYNLETYGSLLSDVSKVLLDVHLYSITGPTSAAFYASDEYNTGALDQSQLRPSSPLTLPVFKSSGPLKL